jgi:hypothetical protein
MELTKVAEIQIHVIDLSCARTRRQTLEFGVILHCAIYTRKSSEDGLEQEFNSLDAQREACEAFIVSQRHAGWIALPDMYDDGGLSGGRWNDRRCSGSSPISGLARCKS